MNKTISFSYLHQSGEVYEVFVNLNTDKITVFDQDKNLVDIDIPEEVIEEECYLGENYGI